MLGYIILDISSTEKGVRDVDSWSDSGLCGEKVTWALLGEILFIDGEGEIEDYLPDHSIWEPLAWLVHSVVIGNGVTRIGNYAFWGFTALKEISIPWSVTEIGEGAFPNRESLPRITGSGKRPRYFARDSMLVDSNSGLVVWPPEKAVKPAHWFAVNDNDCVFRIETGLHSINGTSSIACFGNNGTLIEIRESGGTIIDIECIYLKSTLHEPNLFLPDYRNHSELAETACFYCPDYQYAVRHLCLVNVVQDKMEIILSENLDDVCCYHVEGRVEYYCNNQQEVVFIRIVDLSEYEFSVLG